MTHISELKKGDKVHLVSFGSTDPHYRRKLLSLGVTRGVSLCVVRVAPLGCPVLLEVRGTAISVRKEEARHLILERI